jgi:hypothetical protein
MVINPYEPSRVPDPMAGAVFDLPAEIAYEQTMDDIVAFALDYNRRGIVHKATAGCVSAVVIASVVVGFPALEGFTVESVMMGVIFTIVFVLFLVLLPFARRRIKWLRNDLFMGALLRYLYTRGDTSILIGPRRLSISSTEVVERTPTSESRFSTKLIQKLIVENQRAYIYVSPVQALVVPANAFADPQVFEAFVEALEKLTGLRAIRG